MSDDRRGKVVPIRRNQDKQQSRNPHLELARRLLGSAEPTVASASAELVDRLVVTVQQLKEQVKRLQGQSVPPFKKILSEQFFRAQINFSIFSTRGFDET